MAVIFTLMILLGALFFVLGLKVPKFSNLHKYGIILFSCGLAFAIINSMISLNKERSASTTPSISNATVIENDSESSAAVEAPESDVVVEENETQSSIEKEFDWDAFDASPERAKLSDDVRDMQNNNLKGANFLPFNGEDTGLGNFMISQGLKFTDVSLDCFSSDTHCKLHVHISRKEYPSKVDGYICGAVAYWTAPYSNLKQWTPNEGMALPPLLYEGNVDAVLRKIDYERDRRC
ncbi:hypothetical protein GFH30_00875 [Acinetobacter wanghuae]|uniref:Uncharacterized protein n=1 Tax=Acinetobacter wanghuae TaxID=2662362 RepID=A0A5Q0P2G4_9GAMM|nr:hypothetical protein [Acinetobacter wanghuae]MQW91939.1 hypothetical protein [Acinetobacter wanghuae]QGA10038.1 hypothetical protein GFH30_00875 [Acinetobacter wanghuae]